MACPLSWFVLPDWSTYLLPAEGRNPKIVMLTACFAISDAPERFVTSNPLVQTLWFPAYPLQNRS
eukprot:4756425-Amphidinium_carterae.1